MMRAYETQPTSVIAMKMLRTPGPRAKTSAMIST